MTKPHRFFGNLEVMLDGLKLINCAPSEELEANLMERSKGQCFVLRTCQRTLIVGFNQVPESLLPENILMVTESKAGLDAYEYLLKTICGLKSKILGENEIVHQFKEGYQAFLNSENPNRLIQSLLEKLFKDAKDIRTKHLKNIGLQTYAGISRQIALENIDPEKPLLVLGSGQLAEDFIKISQRNFKIVLCARNSKRVQELRIKYNLEVHSWEKREDIPKYEQVINTIGTSECLYGPKGMSTALAHTFFLDLGEPSPFRYLTNKSYYWSLSDIFEYSRKYREKKNEKLELATQAIKEAAKHRKLHFNLNIPNGWEQLQFA